MKFPTDHELDDFFEFHPYLTLGTIIFFGFVCLKFLGFICSTFFGV
jgi:hypothetical protein